MNKEGAMSALRSLNFVGLTESFEDELRRLQNLFGFRSVNAPRVNASPREDADQALDPEVEPIDLELYNAVIKEFHSQPIIAPISPSGQLGNSI